MPHIALRAPVDGIRGLMDTKPASGRKLSELAEQLLRGPSPLTVGERELIAAYVSFRNGTRYCTGSHSAAAAHALGGDYEVVEAVKRDPASAPVGARMRALLALAGKVRGDARTVGEEDVAAARAAGADDEAIHDTVLIAAAFCMFNRYVDGLAAITPEDPAVYDGIGAFLAAKGYLADRD
ncbi:carboxymuconolactone decarboxylase family protein [Streptomyces sp. NBC_00249]|uniref:carboxymuconolactone decarboxylase family protein n=1 Tax=Streptomyces sp. NBC_00249 TaxID=2975690 RepID=UPI0022565F14|nr:carboxymuconolactone decarboxylase family protein [Streptomyces sp. NBC_00249]MCX5199501.1 carboxymuconolactone decarboxylase family protein [Streptomyces sp. NBC_00249]